MKAREPTVAKSGRRKGEKAAPKKVAPKKVAPKTVAPKKVAPKTAAPRNAVPSRAAPAPDRSSSASMLPSTPAVFIGRKGELERLDEKLSGRVAVAVIDGVPGVGKSALAYAFAERWKSSHKGRVLRAAARKVPIDTFVDELRRLVSKPALTESLETDERIADLAARIEERETLLLLEDLHHLGATERDRLVGMLAGALRRSRVVVTSRERCRPGSGGDYVEVRLAGLGAVEQTELWRSLDELYGVSVGFDTARALAGGNPFLLRRAHAGDLTRDDDPARAATADLSPDALLVARALALFRDKMAFDWLAEVLPLSRARAAVDTLTRKLIVDVDGAAMLGLHDLFRDRLLSEASADDLASISLGLARVASARPAADVARWAGEVTRHLTAAGDHEEACRVLVQRGAEIVKVGATRDLLAMLEAIPQERRSVDAQLTRARCLVRMVRVPEALAEMRRLLEQKIGPRNEALYSIASTNFMAGNIQQALDGYRALLDDKELPQTLRDQVLLAYAWAAPPAGVGDDGRARLREAQRRATTPHDAALFAFYRAVSLWSDDEDAACEKVLAEAGALDPAAAPPFATANLVPPLLAAMLARLHRTEEAKAYRAIAIKEEEKAVQDLQGRLQSLRLEATYDLEIGDAGLAVTKLGDVVRAYERGGSVSSALICRKWFGKALLALGQVEQAIAVFDQVSSRAQEIGLVGLAANVARLRMGISSSGVVLDTRSHELKLPDKTVSLKGRPTLCRILYALARKPEETHTKEQLAHLLWGDRYHPLRHDNAFWVNVRRLRKLLEDTGLSIEHFEEGYRLQVPPGFVVLA